MRHETHRAEAAAYLERTRRWHLKLGAPHRGSRFVDVTLSRGGPYILPLPR